MLVAAITTLALAGAVAAQRPANSTICDYYTSALLKNNTAANQLTLLRLVVNTAVIGNYTKPNVGIAVPGILAKGTYNGTAVNLLPYFDGGLASTNGDDGKPTAQNFLDDGGAVPLMMNKPANGTHSNQYFLLTHLYQFFGSLLGCSQQGMPGFDAYGGGASMYDVHKYMDLDAYQLGYFITQVGLSAASFGVAVEDVTAVGHALDAYFDVRCAAPVTIIPAQGPQLQSICIAANCPLAPNNTCSAYDAAVEPFVADPALAAGQGNSSSTASMAPTGVANITVATTASASATGSASMTSSSSTPTGGAARVAGGAVAGAAALAAFLL